MVGVDLKAEEISVSHRLSPTSDKNSQPTIILRFFSRKTSESVFSQRHRLRSHNKAHPKGRIFIKERPGEDQPTALQPLPAIREKDKYQVHMDQTWSHLYM